MARQPLTKANFDSPSDSPRQAQPEFAANVDKTNAFQNSVRPMGFANAGAGLTIESGAAKVDIGPTDDVDIDFGEMT